MKIEEYTLVRQGLPPLKFAGSIIGAASTDDSEDPFLTIRIYRTKGGTFIGENPPQRVDRRNRTGYDRPEYYANACVGPNPSTIIEWLKEGDETLGKISQAAIEGACKVDEQFAAYWVEHVD